MREPTRHDTSARNRRKALRQARRVLSELEFLYTHSRRRAKNLKYAITKCGKLVNRLKSENDAPR
jgi:hypothetical protein